ncbi:hypothetical protein Pint_13483 [Pistacia integerrima]|uniref:Uncharacterized protein n=1 Tax=Pistacia integerrima TaxID=434235 RepID=A0ACC0Y7L7_9ROSI|nr:hypothetical protein Pint_13483 [Pistacia integerrima]
MSTIWGMDVYASGMFDVSNHLGSVGTFPRPIEAAKGFLAVLRSYLDSLCSNLRSHTITNVQSNNDKVSLLLKESFIDSYPSRERPFMKLFVDTQLFSVHTDLVLSFIQKQ